jgi:hypothetical protein
MFAQAFNFRDSGVQLRLAGLVLLAVTLVCLGTLELGNVRNRRVRTQLIAISTVGLIGVMFIAYISTSFLN